MDSASVKCSTCGNKLKKKLAEENRKRYCSTCRSKVDRDENAAINIRNRGFEKPFPKRFKQVGPSSEAMEGNPVKEVTTEVILKADGSHLSRTGQEEQTAWQKLI